MLSLHGSDIVKNSQTPEANNENQNPSSFDNFMQILDSSGDPVKLSAVNLEQIDKNHDDVKISGDNFLQILQNDSDTDLSESSDHIQQDQIKMSNLEDNTGDTQQVDPFTHGQVFEHNDSVYQAHLCVVTDMKDMRQKDAMFRLNKTGYEIENATHIFTGYNVDGHYVDDQEEGASKIIQSLMRENKIQNSLIIVTRKYGGAHIGNKRWDLIKKCCLQIIESVYHLTDKVKKDKLNNQSDAVRSSRHPMYI